MAVAAMATGCGSTTAIDDLTLGSTVTSQNPTASPGQLRAPRRGEAGAPPTTAEGAITATTAAAPPTTTEAHVASTTSPPSTGSGGSDRPLFGVAVPGADIEQLAALEASAGAEIGVVRVFARWNTDFPSQDHRAILDAGKVIHLSVRPRTDNGEVIPWAEIAAGRPGTEVHDRLHQWLTTVAGYGSQVFFTLNHEPETSDSAANGTPQEYVAAWRVMVGMLRDIEAEARAETEAEPGGGEPRDPVRTVLVLGRGAYASGAIESWYPGDDVVDVVGVDPYNWYRCQGTDRPWTDPFTLIEPALNFAVDHDKPLAIPEIASTEDPLDAERKAAWIADLGRVLASAEVAERLEFVAWFSVHDQGWPDCVWAYDSSPLSAQAFAHLIVAFDD